MTNNGDAPPTEFKFGRTTVRIVQGSITSPGFAVDAVVATDDNYLTMGSGVTRALADLAGPEYVRAAQAQAPIPVGGVVDTEPYRLPEHGLDVKRVFHAAVIDYDSYAHPLEEAVRQATANSLALAEKLGLRSVLLPAFATGAGNLSMEASARQMASAVKEVLGRERSLDTVSIILHLRAEGGRISAEDVAADRALNERFIRAAALVLGTPYDPQGGSGQVRDFFGRDQVLGDLRNLLAGTANGVRHAHVAGGPKVGKSTLLAGIQAWAQEQEGIAVARATFGRIHARTPPAFVYRKLLLGLEEVERDAGRRVAIRSAYAAAEPGAGALLDLLEDDERRIAFLLDDSERLLRMSASGFWDGLEALGERASFVFASISGREQEALLAKLPASIREALLEIPLACLSEAEQMTWLKDLYERYLGREPSAQESTFFQEQAGGHPLLLSLTGHAVVEALQRDRLTNPDPADAPGEDLEPLLKSAGLALEVARQSFFEFLMGAGLEEQDRAALQGLIRLESLQGRSVALVREVGEGDPRAVLELQRVETEKAALVAGMDRAGLQRLEARAFLAPADTPAGYRPMAASFAAWLTGTFLGEDQVTLSEQPVEVEIQLERPDAATLVTRLRLGHEALRLSRAKELNPELVGDFMRAFSQLLNHKLDPVRYPEPGVFNDLEAVGNSLLTLFMTFAIRSYFNNPPTGSSILLEIDESLKHFPWELMLETAYKGEFPFRVGRVIVTEGEQHRLRERPGSGKIKALLIGDPTDDLVEARAEVQWLADRLAADPRFEPPDVLLGSAQCTRMELLQNYLGSGRYALVHYSGHSQFDGYHSAWQLKNGESLETSMLTSSLQNGPPALVVSSSCESAEAGEPAPLRYEDQSFDLPGAFLQAGVGAYVGTLWEVESTQARLFVQAFYQSLLDGRYNLGECLRRAKVNRIQAGDEVNWPAFVLYGDPNTEPGDLLPALRNGGAPPA